MYQEFYKQRNYVDAYEPWLQVYKICPANHVNTYIRGGTILKTKIAREKDPAKRQEFIDLLMEMWDKRSEYFGDAGKNMGYKAMDMKMYQPKKVAETYEMFKKALELGVGDAGREAVIPFFFFESAMANEKAGNISKEDVLEAYDIASVYLEKMYKANPKDTMLSHALSNLDIAFEPYASCEEIIPLYEKKYEDNKDNIAFLEKICKVLDRKNCNESELFFKATEALHALKPTPATAYLMAKMCDGKKDFSKVVEYLKDDITKLESERDQVRAYMLLAKAYMNEARLAEGRASAQKALDINPQEGRAYILIGLMYALTKNCGDDAQVAHKSVFWAAVDKFRKAKEVDPNCAEEADKLIKLYANHFPSGDDLFFLGVHEGSSYRVGCWIQESTIVRKR